GVEAAGVVVTGVEAGAVVAGGGELGVSVGDGLVLAGGELVTLVGLVGLVAAVSLVVTTSLGGVAVASRLDSWLFVVRVVVSAKEYVPLPLTAGVMSIVAQALRAR